MDLETAGKGHFIPIFTALKFESQVTLKNWFFTPLRNWQRYQKNDDGFFNVI